MSTDPETALTSRYEKDAAAFRDEGAAAHNLLGQVQVANQVGYQLLVGHPQVAGTEKKPCLGPA